MNKSLSETAAEYELQRVALARRLKNSERIIGDVRVGMTCNDGVVGISLYRECSKIFYLTATDFLRIVGWFEKHYGATGDVVDQDKPEK